MNTKPTAASQTSPVEITKRKDAILAGSPSKDFIVAAKCLILKNGSEVTMSASALPGMTGGSFSWHSDSKLLALSTNVGPKVKIRATGEHGSGRDSETVSVTMTSATGAVKTKEVRVTVAKVVFSASSNQRYGFDDFDTPADPNNNHLSVREGDHTFVSVQILGGATSNDFNFEVADSTICTVTAPPASDAFDLRIDAARWEKASTRLNVKIRCPSREVFASLDIHVYALKVAKIRVSKLYDPAPGREKTHLNFPNENYAAHASAANDYLKAAVVKLSIEELNWGRPTYLCFKDVPGEALRFDMGEENGGAEIDRIRHLLQPNTKFFHEIVILRKIEYGFFLEKPARAGDTSITVKGKRFREDLEVEILDGPLSEKAFVTDGIKSNIGKLKAPLKYGHPAGTFVLLPVLGTSRDIVLMQEGSLSAAELRWIVVHEAVHATLDLVDIDDNTNIMHYVNKFTDYRIRYCPRIKKKYSGTENQWDIIDRSIE